MLSLADPALALSGVTGPGGVSGAAGGLVITGALSALGCATLAPDAVVHPLLPHDADVVLEGTGADLVLIEAAALLPGQPWAYATDPAAADRGRRLARMIVMARALGKPVVLLRNVPPSLMPGLGWLAASCDAVVDGGLGVQLARFNPVGRVRGPADRPALRRGAGPAGGARRPRPARLADRRARRAGAASGGRRVLARLAGAVPGARRVRHRVRRPGARAARLRRAGDRARSAPGSTPTRCAAELDGGPRRAARCR